MAATPGSPFHVAAAMSLVLLFLAPIVATSSVSGPEMYNGSCITAERDALLSFKAGISSDPNTLLTSWRGKDCCKWYGVECSSSTGHVVMLNLSNDFYMVEISSSLLALRYLKHLDLSGNVLMDNMSIPEFIGSLKSLIYLDLSNMNFNGRVPHQLGNLTKLVYLNINVVYFPHVYSSDVSWLASLQSLQQLDMSSVDLSAAVDWFHVVNTLPNLRALYLSHCGLNSSTLSLVKHNLTDLEELDLSGNVFRGDISIMEFISSLKSLTYLDMNFNGRVPPQLGNLSKLVHLDIHTHLAYSSDVSWLARLKSLEYLDMSGVNLSAVVDWVHAVNNLPNLRLLYLCYCNLNSSTTSLHHHNLTVLEELGLSGNHFNSPAAPNWYWDVTSLKSLEISDSELSGPFPDELGNLTMLESLYMGWNNIEGMIPATLKNLCSLQIIYLPENNIGGDLTDLIERLPNSSWNNLQDIILFRTNITGTTLNSVLNLSAISALYIQENHISGSVPVEIGTLKYLTELHIGGNNLSGVISEAHFSGLTNLYSIDLADSYLEVKVNSDWEPPFDLGRAFLSSCQLGSQVPNWLRWQNNMHRLEISDAGLVGRIPDWFWTTFSNAYHLDLSYNQMSGELPLNLESMSAEELLLQSNQLTGSIPKLPTSIMLLDMSNNSLSGQLPSNFGTPRLQVVVLFSNCISGTIPYSICQLPHLQVLDISNNLLTEGLPDCGMEELRQNHSNNSSRVNPSNSYSLEIHTLRLNNNSLSGGFPLFFKQCQNLMFLDLTQNRFRGYLPTWISEDMPWLVMLRLRSNNFSGNIPIETMRLSSLRILDLANNTFSGIIPKSLVNLKALTTYAVALDSRNVSFLQGIGMPEYTIYYIGVSDHSIQLETKGQALDYTKNAIFFMSIDLSCNRLTGQIPEQIGSLHGLVNLNLSSNFLSGNIPYKISYLQALESLDLSNNQLSGEIPRGFSNLTSLSYLNLSYNNLSGRIPSGHQLDTLRADDPASMYIGNPGLCGHPLLKLCPGDLPTQDDPIEWHEDDNTQMDFHLGLSVGILVGLWIICCGLLLKKAWRHAYFSLFDKLYVKLYAFAVVTWQKWFRQPGTN